MSDSKDKTPAPAKKPERVELYKGSDGAAIVFPRKRNPGVDAFGALKPDVEYVVAPDEAARLTSDKRALAHRFDFVSTADAKRVADHLAAIAAKAAADAAKAAAATTAAAAATSEE